MANLVNVDGKLGSEEDRLLSAFDQGFLFGASVYETIRTYQGKTFLLARHLRRLRDSADALDIRLDASDEEIAARVQETLVAAGNAESSIRIVVSAGVGAIDYREGSASRPTVVIVVRPLPEYPESLYREGARAVFVSVMRAAPGGLDPRIKSSNVLTNLMALREAHRKNAYEALMLNPRGEVAEGSMSNVFIVSKGVVRTPPISAGILEGITRELVIEVAREGGYPVEERAFAPKELFEADEVFITASARQIVPIVRVDETLIGNGNPGPVTRQLIARYQDKVSTLI
ncbi:MAG: aminotransferase class IV, partial [Vicinamibacteria bacterium]